MRYVQEKSWVQDPTQLSATADRYEKAHARRFARNNKIVEHYYDESPLAANDNARADRRYELESLALDDERIEDLGENLILEVVNGSLALTVRKLQCKVTPTGAEDFETLKACEIVGHLVDSVFEESGFHDLALQAAKDGHLCDVGPLQGSLTPDGEIVWSRKEPNCVLWPMDGTAKPRTIITETAVPRQNAADKWPKHADEIMHLPGWSPKVVVGLDGKGYDSANSDTIRVLEATYTALGGSKGKRVVAAGKIVLEPPESWPYEEHNTIVYRWDTAHRGFGGLSLGHVIRKDHEWIRKFMEKAYGGLRGSGAKILAHEDDAEDIALSDLDVDVVPFKGPVPPQIQMPQLVSPELLQEAERRRARAWAKSGVNPNLGTGAGAPSGYTSGRAQREFISGASARLLPQNRALENLYRDGAKVVLMLAAQLLQRRTKVPVRSATGEFLREVTWQDIKSLITSKKYQVTFGLVSGLSLDPAGRLQDLDDLSKLLPAQVTPEVIAANLDLPDVDRLTARLTAGKKLIDKLISKAINDGEFKMPPDTIDAARLVQEVTAEINLAEERGIFPKKNMAALRKLLAAGKAMLEPPPTAPVLPSQAPPSAPVATAGPPPGAPLPPISPGPPPSNDNGAPPILPPGVPA